MKSIISIIEKYIDIAIADIYIYGSSSYDISIGRDVDVLVLSRVIKKTFIKSSNIYIGGVKKEINIHFVSNKYMILDIYKLLFGGFYADKFAIGFFTIQENAGFKFPTLYWTSKLYTFFHLSELDSEKLIKLTHANIFKYQPTFLRSLSKFSDENKMQLVNFIEKCIFMNFDPSQKIPLPTIAQHKSRLYNFFSEYNKHKCDSEIWGDKTLAKIAYSVRTGI